MGNSLQEIILRAHTALFGQKTSQTLVDMVQCPMELQANTLSKGFYKPTGSFTVFAHFNGMVQGDFILSTEIEAAARIAGCAELAEVPAGTWNDAIEKTTDFFGELLNVAAGRTLPELQKKYGPLTITSPAGVSGKIRFPNVLSGSINMVGQVGTINCTLAVNMVRISDLHTAKTAPYSPNQKS